MKTSSACAVELARAPRVRPAQIYLADRAVIEGKETITRSNPAHFPSSLRQKRSLVQAAPEDEEGEGAGGKRATVRRHGALRG